MSDFWQKPSYCLGRHTNTACFECDEPCRFQPLEILKGQEVQSMEDAICPWCGEEVSDSPIEDFAVGITETDCGCCGEPVRVSTAVRFERRVDRIEK